IHISCIPAHSAISMAELVDVIGRPMSPGGGFRLSHAAIVGRKSVFATNPGVLVEPDATSPALIPEPDISSGVSLSRGDSVDGVGARMMRNVPGNASIFHHDGNRLSSRF